MRKHQELDQQQASSGSPTKSAGGFCAFRPRGPRRPIRQLHEATDEPLEARPEDLESIRSHFGTIEKMLSGLFGNAYARGPEADTVRTMAADLIEDDFDEIVEEWSRSIEIVFGGEHAKRRPNMANALI